MTCHWNEITFFKICPRYATKQINSIKNVNLFLWSTIPLFYIKNKTVFMKIFTMTALFHSFKEWSRTRPPAKPPLSEMFSKFRIERPPPYHLIVIKGGCLVSSGFFCSFVMECKNFLFVWLRLANFKNLSYFLNRLAEYLALPGLQLLYCRKFGWNCCRRTRVMAEYTRIHTKVHVRILTILMQKNLTINELNLQVWLWNS